MFSSSKNDLFGRLSGSERDKTKVPSNDVLDTFTIVESLVFTLVPGVLT